MSDDAPFIEEMREDPTNPVARLIYADWLEERGDIRGSLNRLAASNAVWYCGNSSRKSALDALHFAWNTSVRISLRDEFYVADAEHIFHAFAHWIVEQMLSVDPIAREDPPFPYYFGLLQAKQTWLDGQLATERLDEQIAGQRRTNERPVFTAMRLAANTTALCAAKHTSRFAQRSRLEVVSLDQQNFELTQMLIDQCQWQQEKA